MSAKTTFVQLKVDKRTTADRNSQCVFPGRGTFR
jgi:hypothetical protein